MISYLSEYELLCYLVSISLLCCTLMSSYHIEIATFLINQCFLVLCFVLELLMANVVKSFVVQEHIYCAIQESTA
jgi:hypothetical protein